MSQQNYFTFTSPEEVIQRGHFFPYWEIRDEQNRFLMSKKPKDGETIIGSNDHNNDSDLDLEKAIDHFVAKGKGFFKFIRVKLGTSKNATTNHSYYAINLSDNQEVGDVLNGMIYQPHPSNPNMIILNGPKAGQQEVVQNPSTNYAEALEAATMKMQAAFEQNMNKALMAMERQMFNKEKEEFEKQKLEWESKKEEELNGAVKAVTQYGFKQFMDDVPSLTGALIDVVGAVQDLKKDQKVGTTINGAEKKETSTTKKVEPKERPKVTFTKKGEEKEKTTPTKPEEKTEVSNDIFAGLNDEEKEAMKEVAKGLKEKKIHPQEIVSVVKAPEDFFEEEKEEKEEKEETKTDTKTE